MATRISPPVQQTHRRGWWRAMHLWQRVLFVLGMLGALVISAALIYFEPGSQAFPNARSQSSPAPTAISTPSSQNVPGIDEYWYWGQSLPRNLQP